jgi:hypothetical protein
MIKVQENGAGKWGRKTRTVGWGDGRKNKSAFQNYGTVAANATERRPNKGRTGLCVETP